MAGSSAILRLLPLLSLVISLSAISPTANAGLIIPDYTQRDAPSQAQRDQAHHVYKQQPSKDDSPLQERKSLGFGPIHSHQVFISSAVDNDDDSQFSTSSVHSNSIRVVNSLPGSRKPERVALRLAKYLMDNHQTDKGIELFLRSDSYLDTASGIYHAFVRQRLNGIQIADGDLNVAIDSKGNVLSYGSSLYHGFSPDPLTNPSDTESSAGSAFCRPFRQMIDELLSIKTGDEEATSEYVQLPAQGSIPQRPFKFKEASEKASDTLSHLQQLLFTECDDPRDSPLLQGAKVSGSRKSSTQIKDPRQALITFLSEASTDPKLASQLKAYPDAFVETISQSFIVMNLEKLDSTSRTTDDKEDYVVLNGAPETTGEVKATLKYVQTENGKLALTWNLEVPMKNNHYETYVDATRDGLIHSAIDWVKSSSHKKQNKILPSLERPDFNRPSKEEHKVIKEDVKITKDDSPLYKVYEWGTNDPSEGTRALLQAPFKDEEAAPLGWHTIMDSNPFSDSTTFSSDGNYTTFHDTRGNFVFASADIAGTGQWLDVKRPQAQKGEDGVPSFDFTYGYKKALKNHEDLSPHKYKDAATTQLFYTINSYAQLLYRYGFDEASGNFQQENFGRGGKGGDAVIAFAQDGVGMNNADFYTPPDSQHPRMRMYLWTGDLQRDGDFEAGVVIHEFSHGLSTRLVGGPMNSGCLGFGESGGMGEGWGDFYATTIRQHSAKNKDWTMGEWVADSHSGIRKYPYSTNTTVDPAMYASLNTMFEVHSIGAVWAEMLFEVLEALISKHGWQNTLFPPLTNSTQEVLDDFYLTDSELDDLSKSGFQSRSSRKVPRRGNTLTLQLVTDSFKLMPCRPSLQDSRDAVLLADKHLTGGRDECLIWKAFAKRGLGVDAKMVGSTPWGGGVRTNGFSTPKKCSK